MRLPSFTDCRALLSASPCWWCFDIASVVASLQAWNTLNDLVKGKRSVLKRWLGLMILNMKALDRFITLSWSERWKWFCACCSASRTSACCSAFSLHTPRASLERHDWNWLCWHTFLKTILNDSLCLYYLRKHCVCCLCSSSARS